MQTCQNCVHKQMSTISITTLLLDKHVKIASISKCPLYQSLHFYCTNMSKLRPCPLYQSTTLFLCKHVKIASISKCPLYQSTTLLLHKHVKIASISKCPLYQSLHNSYADVHHISTIIFLSFEPLF
jgi:hypothetical protein